MTAAKQHHHLVIKIVKRLESYYVHFTCPSHPRMPLVSYGLPKLCPICRSHNPLRWSVKNTQSYSDVLGEDIVSMTDASTSRPTKKPFVERRKKPR